MATVNPTQAWIGKRSSKTTWANMLTTDVGAPSSGHRLSDKTVQVIGTAGGGTILLQGSNDNGVTWSTLKDPNGTDIATLATGDLSAILENPQMIRPSVVGGDGTTSLTVILLETSTA